MSVVRRLAWAAAGLLCFLWVGYEDRGIAGVLLVAAAICTAATLQLLAAWLNAPAPGPGARLLRFTAWGAAAGLGVGPVAAVLMLLKLSLHTHDLPDFSPTQILSVLRAVPWRAAQGAALGLALGGMWLLGRGADGGRDRSGTIHSDG